MLMGPVFRAELLRTGRQRRYYVLRFLYATLLLLLVWSGYEQMRRGHPVVHPSDVAAFAADVFMVIAILQLATVLLLIPAVFGGAIADEKQRTTLHYLMASQLSGGEIILDKVLGRSAVLAIFVAIGLPIVGLLSLFGGISLESIIVAYVATFSTAAFAIAMTVLISTLARRVRDAVLSAYLLLLMWLFVPPLVRLVGIAIAPGLYYWIQPVNDWLADTSPLGLWLGTSLVRAGRTPTTMTEPFLWMVGYQLAGALVMLLIAIVRLRPTFRRHEETPVRRARAGRRRRWSAHPECGDDPVRWKERYFAPVDRFTRVVLIPAIVFITLPLALLTEVEGGLFHVLTSFWEHGFAARHSLPEAFLWILQVDLAWYSAFWLLAVAGASASCMTIEREKDTWVSLTATPLTGREILRGKVIGALRNQRGFAAVLIALWALGLFTGAVHPLGIVASIATIALLTSFVATVGAYASLRSSSTSRAMAATLVALACFNGYPLILLLWFLNSVGWSSSYPVLGAMPSLIAWSMVSPRSVIEAWNAVTTGTFSRFLIPLTLILFGVLGIYTATALSLTRRILGELDRWLFQQPLSRKPVTRTVPARDLEEITAP